MKGENNMARTTYSVELHGKHIEAEGINMVGPSGVVGRFDNFEQAFKEAVRATSEQSTVTIYRWTYRDHADDGIVFTADGSELRKIKSAGTTI